MQDNIQGFLRLFGDIAFRGNLRDCHYFDGLVNKWDCINTKVQELMDDGLTFESHCLSLYIQQDKTVWDGILEIFEKTRKQGKTIKTIRNRKDYFYKHFSKWVGRHSTRLLAAELEECKDKPYDEKFRYDEGLVAWWWNYYLGEYEKDIAACAMAELYPVTDHQEVIVNAVMMDKRMKGNRTEPKFTCPASYIKLCVQAREKPYVLFEWRKLSNASEMMGKFDAKRYDWDADEPALKKLKKLVPKAVIDCMDTPQNLYGDTNDWFYVYFHWEPKDFSFAQVRKAERAVKQLIVPKLGTFKRVKNPTKAKE